ncbi:hypothetical protein GCM10009827_119580 [Dactylosporangium maewongense]|uniref:LuxR family transcriptional regulator n=1 Tax=Dactylosporangium maewongense TaxID=634393 RepID=A0ABN2DKM9_9ACTN
MTGGQAHRDQLAFVLSGAYAAMLDGNMSAAASLIAGVLGHFDRERALADPVVVELAVVWAAIAAEADGAQADVVAWARWSVTAATERFGEAHRVVRRARLVLGRVLTAHGDHLAAAEAYWHCIADLDALGQHDDALHLRAVRATALHAGGRCYAAVHELTAVRRACLTAATATAADVDTTDGDEADAPADVWGGRVDSAAAQYGAQLIAMLTACGRFQEARAVTGPEAWTASGKPRRPATGHESGERFTDVGTAVGVRHVLVCERQRHVPLRMRLQPARRRSWTDPLP